MGQPMQVLTILQRKAVSLGLLWGTLSAAETDGTVVSLLRLPRQIAAMACKACGMASQPMLVYILGILLATFTSYWLVTALEHISSRLLYWRAGPSKAIRGHNQQGRNK